MEIYGKDIFIKEIDSTLNSLVELNQFLLDIFSCYQLNNQLKFNIRISLVEAVNNSIKHGNRLNSKKTVIITCIRFRDRLTFKIHDEGKGFTQNPSPITKENLSEPNGRGVFIIKNCCDNYFTLDNGRVTQLEFKID